MWWMRTQVRLAIWSFRGRRRVQQCPPDCPTLIPDCRMMMWATICCMWMGSHGIHARLYKVCPSVIKVTALALIASHRESYLRWRFISDQISNYSPPRLAKGLSHSPFKDGSFVIDISPWAEFQIYFCFAFFSLKRENFFHAFIRRELFQSRLSNTRFKEFFHNFVSLSVVTGEGRCSGDKYLMGFKGMKNNNFEWLLFN